VGGRVEFLPCSRLRLGTLFLWSRYQALSFYRLAALLAPGALLWGSAGWLACWLEGCAYGREAVFGWFSADLPDEYGVYAVRYQTQLLGAGRDAAPALLIWRLAARLPAAPLFWLALALAGGSRALVSLWRGDPAPEVAGWRLDAILDMLLAAAGSAIFAGMLVWRRPVRRHSEVVHESESRSRPD
jgi:prolipoprotein diacylglyceryltransferase